MSGAQAFRRFAVDDTLVLPKTDATMQPFGRFSFHMSHRSMIRPLSRPVKRSSFPYATLIAWGRRMIRCLTSSSMSRASIG
ncbi:MAG TPA: hypothetical protein PLU93_10125, partial [Treponemataceae bacterium]|nr:hypothetical protein [Treponemataceae bacterium]